MVYDLDRIQAFYAQAPGRVAGARNVFGRPLTLTEKILAAHLAEPLTAVPERRRTYVGLHPDRVAMQDATAQMALLQLMVLGDRRTAVPATVHCDHLIRARQGAGPDLDGAVKENQEVYAFLRSVAAKAGLGFWPPGSGIIHQVLLEHYAFPGGLMIGTDSHTPNAGGLGMLAVGVGGADAVDAMAGMPWELAWPGVIGVKLVGRLEGWASPKDVILLLAGLLTVAGGTGCVLEYFGPGTAALSATGKATIGNMGAEVGATGSVFPFDERMATYLRATGRAAVAELAQAAGPLLAADPEVAAAPGTYYDRVIELDLSRLEPHIVGPATPDLDRPLSRFKAEIAAKGYPATLKAGLIGSCTNSSYEDLGRAASVARQALALGLKAQSQFLVTPGSEQIRATIARDGYLATFEALGGKVLANACGPCIGQWQRQDVSAGEKNAIVTSFNRNFKGRADGNAATLAFITSPEIVTALVIAGRLDFNPATDELTTPDGRRVKLAPPTGDELPPHGFAEGSAGYVAPAADPTAVRVEVRPGSERLQLLTPFAAWEGRDLTGLHVLLKAVGKCTTDHISPAGPWLKFRGHLDRISDNLFSGATNAFAQVPGQGHNHLTGERNVPLAAVARGYLARDVGWVAVGDQNYGEGSSREHAAMSPRHLGCRAVVARSFARIHETNLKKQGILPLTFQDPAAYDRVRDGDVVDLLGLTTLAPGQSVTVLLHHADGTEDRLTANHTLSALQVAWFRAGSALNLLAGRSGG